MNQETMDLEQLADYLQRDVREVSKMASRGHLPGQKVAGQWRFAQAEINYWLETQLPSYTEEELLRVESGAARGHAAQEVSDSELLVTSLLSESTTAVPLQAGTKASALRELVRLAEQSWQVFDAEALLAAVKLREEMGSTALLGGLAIPHPRRPLPNLLGESIIAFGRTPSGIPFGGDEAALCDLFFLVCCRDHRTHLQVLARIARMQRRPSFADDLRAAETVSETLRVIEMAERGLGEE